MWKSRDTGWSEVGGEGGDMPEARNGGGGIMAKG